MSDAQRGPRELGSLGFAVAPLLVMVVATVLFELFGFDLHGLAGEIGITHGEADDELGRRLREGSARLVWSATVLLFYGASAAAVVVSWSTLRRAVPSASVRRRLWTVGVVLAALNIASIAASAWRGGAQCGIFSFTYQCIEQWGRFSSLQVTGICVAVTLLNLLAAVVPALVVVAACGAVARLFADPDPTIASLEGQVRRLRLVLAAGSALMVVGILHMGTWLRWPAEMVADEAVAGQILSLAEAVSVFWGATYTLAIVAVIVPPAMLLHRRAAELLAAHPALAGNDEPREWLKKRGFWVSPLGQLPQIAAMLAPLLAGPLGATLGKMAMPLGG